MGELELKAKQKKTLLEAEKEAATHEHELQVVCLHGHSPPDRAGATPCGRFNHKSEDCKIAKNKLQKEVNPTGLTSLKGLKVSLFNESENSKCIKVKPLIDQNNFVEVNKGIKVNIFNSMFRKY